MHAAEHPPSVNKVLFTSLDKLAAFDAFAYQDTVSPRPIRLIDGSKADTTFFSDAAYAKAQEPKEIFTIEGASHIDLYDKPHFVSQAAAKTSEYFSKYLKRPDGQMVRRPEDEAVRCANQAMI